MERMEDLEEMLRELSDKYKNSKSVEVYEEDLGWWFKIIDDLREENKKLNTIIENTKIEQEADRKHIEELEEENKKLNIKVASLEWEIKWLNYTIEKLREELSAYDREYFDEGKKAKNIFMEEDTLQELRDIGKR